MKKVAVQRLDKNQVGEVYHAYMYADFKGHGLKPLEFLYQMMDQGMYECLGLFEDGQFCAYGYLVRDPQSRYLLLDYLAVCPDRRGCGYGEAFLRQLRQYFSGEPGIFIESESESSAADEEQWAVCHRRMHFYLKNGCQVTGYKSRLAESEYNILYIPIGEAAPDTASALGQIYRLMRLADLYEGRVRIWKRHRWLEQVRSWETEDQSFRERRSLTYALMPEGGLPRVISLVGGGGKTTTMYQLADELAEQGKRVLVTTTTHIRRPDPEDGPAALIRHVGELADFVWDGRILTAGKPLHTEDLSFRKLTMPEGLDDPEELARLLDAFDVILVEADGAKRLPLKIPEDWEPVLLPQTGMVIACAGLSAVGQTFGETCFRFDSKGAWLRREGTDRIAPEDLALILMDERGSHKQVCGRYYRIVLNQADDRQRRDWADQVLRALPVTLRPGCIVTSYG